MKTTIGETPSKRLLVVDDDIEAGRLVARVAESLGYTAEAFTEAEPFLVSVDRGAVEVILLDLTIPGTDGIELLGKLSLKKVRATIFIMSGFDVAYQRMAIKLGRARNLTMGGLIPKPMRVAELRKRLSEIAER